MHPPIEQLLADSGSTEAPEIEKHLENCLRCRTEVEDFRRTRDRLAALPQLEPPEESWTNIQSALHAPSRAPSRTSMSRILYVAAAAGAAALAVLGIDQLRTDETTKPASAAAHVENAQASDDLAALMQQSRHLDLVLQGLPNRPRVERVAMAATLDSIEDRIQWLDLQLTYASAAEVDETQTQTLWRERVELMDSLVKVRYAQVGRASF